LLALLCSLFAGERVYAQAKPVAVPAAVKARLDANYPGWRLAEISPEAYEHYSHHRLPFQPNFLWGDFDGDGRRDYAIEITHPGPKGEQRMVVLAFLRRGEGFEEHLLETGISTLDVYLWPHRAGERDFDFEREREFRYRHDAIGVVYGEVAGVSYVFENGSFRKIVSSD
jgi:hypothetical protein